MLKNLKCDLLAQKRIHEGINIANRDGKYSMS